MTRLWHDFQSHKRAALLLLAYWVATLAVIPFTWHRGIPLPVVLLLFTTPLIAGVLVAWWRASALAGAARPDDRISGATLAGALIAEITFLVMKGGAVDEAISWLHGNEFRGGEVLGFAIGMALIGMLLGGGGAMLAIRMNRSRHHVSTTPSTLG